MTSAGRGASQNASNTILNFATKAAPPIFTFPVLAFKAFIPSLMAVFVLGTALAIAMYFRAPKLGVTQWHYRILMAVTCFAWLLIIDEGGANEILNKFILGNSVDDHTYLIRFVAGAIIAFHIFIFGVPSDSKTSKQKAAKPAQARTA